MSQPSRPRASGPEQRRPRAARLEAVTILEERKLLAPYVSEFPTVATFTAFANNATGSNLGNITVTYGGNTTLNDNHSTFPLATASFPEAAAITSISELTPTTSFGGDIVRIRSGPGGDFGNEVYAISRGAGDNAATGAINRPGVIYRVDPATGKSSVFFDLNTVIPQLDSTQTSAANSAGQASGLVNWYDMTFDREGVFDGKPSLFVSSVDSTNPAKNAIYRIAPDGTFMGAFTTFSGNSVSATRLTFNPSAILVPPVQQQQFLRGLISGGGTSTTFAALYFDATQFRPGTPINSTTLPTGVRSTALFESPQTGLTAANVNYTSQVYDTFADFGTPSFSNGGVTIFPASPGYSGVQGLNNDLLINLGNDPNGLANTAANPTPLLDTYPLISTNYRRFEDIAFDQYGYFSQGLPITNAAANGSTTGGTGTGALGNLGSPLYAGSLFAADLSSGLAVSVAVPTPATGSAATPAPIPILIPVQGPGEGGITLATSTSAPQIFTPTQVDQGPGVNDGLGGRIVRIDPSGRVTDFAQGFHTNNSLTSTSFINSSLSITFSSDGTTLYAADDDGIWQFKTTASLAGASSGSLVGLNDLRTLGVPYDGSNSAVAVVDTGVDAANPSFRGRVSPGTSTAVGGALGNDDLAVGLGTGSATGGTTGGVTGGLTGTGNATLGLSGNGHGTPVAGIIAQFVPNATIEPVNVFDQFALPTLITGGTTTNAGGGGTIPTFATNASTTTDEIFNGLRYVANNPYVQDPVRPQDNDRVITASLAFGTAQTFESEQTAYKQYPQVVISFKNQLDKLLKVGIAPIAAAGQLGAPIGANRGTGTTTTTGNTTVVTQGATNNAENGSSGDVNGMSFPAVLNEVVSVTGTYPFLYTASASTAPTDPATTTLGRFRGPVLVFGNFVNDIGLTADSGANSGLDFSAATVDNSLAQLTAADGAGSLIVSSDRLLGSVNRSTTTDFSAPALDAPTFRRTYAGDGFDSNTFQEGGTSVSSAIVTGSYALVSSALDYWDQIRRQGSTPSAYLNAPVGSHVLNFGSNKLYNLSTYNTPNGINGILAYTSVPAADINAPLSLTGPPLLLGSTLPRSYARVDVGNAIAAIEGKVALDYLIKHNTFNIIDANHDNLITSQEIQNFVDKANSIGLPEAGAMARLLGGTARSAVDNSFTQVGEQPDQPDVLQRRFNFFDYSAHGKLQGSISIAQLKLLSKYILPTPDAFNITDRQRASGNGFLIAPASQRNFKNLQHLQRGYEFVPKGAYKRYNGLSPAQFGVNTNVKSNNTSGPIFTLFDSSNGKLMTGSAANAANSDASSTANIPLTQTNTLSTVSGNFAPAPGSTAGTSATPTTTATGSTGTTAATSAPATSATTAPAAPTTASSATPTAAVTTPATTTAATPTTPTLTPVAAATTGTATTPTAAATAATSSDPTATYATTSATTLPSTGGSVSTATPGTLPTQTTADTSDAGAIAQKLAALLAANQAAATASTATATPSTATPAVITGAATPKATTSVSSKS